MPIGYFDVLAPGTYNDIGWSPSTGTKVSVLKDGVDASMATGDGTYNEATPGGGGATVGYDSFTVTPRGLFTIGRINTVEMAIRFQQGVDGAGRGLQDPLMVRLGGVDLLNFTQVGTGNGGGDPDSGSVGGSNIALPRPGGGVWTVDDFATVQLGYAGIHWGAAPQELRVMFLALRVDYANSGGGFVTVIA